MAQRYADAIRARPFAQMTVEFERAAQERPLPASIRDPEAIRRANRSYVVNSTAKNVEALAGAGELVNAQVLLGRLLAFDSSDATKAAVRERLQRAGQAQLLPR
jgi:hypothetical protein